MSTQHINIDVAIIGAGTAGLSAYRAARKQGASALLIEGGPYGTTCARVGCMPSKLLIAAAEAMHAQERLAAFGIDVPAARVDGVRVMQRVLAERDRFVGFVLEGVDEISATDKLRGYAKFKDSHTLEVALEAGGTAIVNAKSIVIATGSTPFKPTELAAAGDRLVVNDDIFAWTDLPKSVLVLGAGVIGLELGQALSRLGGDTTLIGRHDHMAMLSDPVVLDTAIGIFRQEMHYISDGAITAVARSEAGVVVTYTDNDKVSHTKTVDYLISTAGRRVNLPQLDLAAAHIAINEKGIPNFNSDTMQIDNSHVFLAGDVNAELQLLHEAADEGAIAGANAARIAQSQDVQADQRRTPLSIVFSDPNIATVGTPYRSLDLIRSAAGEVSFHNQGRSRVMLVNQGKLRVYADTETRRLLGAEMIGPRNEHIAHLLAWAHQMGLTVDQMLDLPFYHPVIEEGLRTALRDLASNLNRRATLAND